MSPIDAKSIQAELSQKEVEYENTTRNMTTSDVIRIEQSAHLPLGTDESGLVTHAHSLFVRLNELRAQVQARGE